MQNSGANDIRQLNQVAPSLLVSSTGSEANGSARIRGIGTVGDNPGLESSVPVFIDGVYRSRSGIGLNELGEIDRVEVQRSEERRVGKEWVSSCRSRWAPDTSKKNTNTYTQQ